MPPSGALRYSTWCKVPVCRALLIEIFHRMVFLAGESETPESAWVGRDKGLVHLDNWIDRAQVTVHVFLYFGMIEGRFALGNHDPIRF